MFEMGSVSVTLEWIPEEGVSYSVSFDQVVDLRYTQRTASAVALMVPYNIPTNVTITATSCGHNGETAITQIQLTYGIRLDKYCGAWVFISILCVLQVDVRIHCC